MVESGVVRVKRGDFIRSLPCFVCYDAFYIWLMGEELTVQLMICEMAQTLAETMGIQQTRTEFAHLGLTTSRRGMAQKHDDAEAGPLCAGHHREFGDSHHAGTETFWAKHRVDRDGLIRMLQAIYENGPTEATI